MGQVNGRGRFSTPPQLRGTYLRGNWNECSTLSHESCHIFWRVVCSAAARRGLIGGEGHPIATDSRRRRPSHHGYICDAGPSVDTSANQEAPPGSQGRSTSSPPTLRDVFGPSGLKAVRSASVPQRHRLHCDWDWLPVAMLDLEKRV